MASSYSFVNDKFEPALDWNMSWAGGAGAMYSTVGDLFRWNEALFGGRVLSDASLKAATTPVELPPNVDGMNYGYGLMMLKVKRLPAVGHGGGLNGWSTYLVRLPEQKCTVVVLANALPLPPAQSPSSIAHALAERLLADEIQELPPLVEDKTIDPKTFTDFVGRFDYQSGIMTVSVEGDEIFSQITGQSQHRIYPLAKDAFFWKVADAEVKFLRDEKGQVIAARHSQNGTVSRDGAQLFAQLTGQPKFPIFPKAEAEFEWRVVAASVIFSKGDDGIVTKAIHSQNGTTFDAPKIK
jgi:CubicO group peptidase (beta-lactamase class C family)